MQIRQARADDIPAMVHLAVEQQAVPEHHIGYLGMEADSIAADIAAVEQWAPRTAVLVDSEALAGWLLGERDDDMDRVWWWGPFIRGGAWGRADALYTAACDLAGASQQEMGPDDRNRQVEDLAGRHGFSAEGASAVLSYFGASLGRGGGTVALDDAHRDDVARLHDRLFPGTHTTGRSLVSSGHPRLMLVEEDHVVGYAAVEMQSDGTGYIDYLGVDPGWWRRGIGRRLVIDATDVLLELGARSVHLTVRESNAAARALYASLGFIHERIIRPYRKGFSLE